jgi:uncharacterized protein (TIGR02147 family)
LQTVGQKKTSLLEKNVLSIYGYTDYRKYLKDFYEFRKSGPRGYSYRSFSKSAGLSSPNFLKLVIENERNVGKESIPGFINALGLGRSMARYFEALVHLNQAKSDAEKEKYFQELKLLTPESKRRDLNTKEYEYLSHWLYPVIREMISLKEFRDDPYWISRRLNGKAKVSEIQLALQFLKTEKFIVKNGDRYEAVDNMVVSSDEVFSLAIRNYHREMLSQAKESLETLSVEEREFGAIIFALPESSLAELKQRMKKFRNEIHEWACQAITDDPGDMVVQLNLQMYPHTKDGGK